MAALDFSPNGSVSNSSSISQDEGRQQQTLSSTCSLIIAVFLGIIGSLGITNNFLVLILFCQYKVLRTPINMLLMNISASDLMVCIVGTPFSFAASIQGRWLIGEAGCIWYGFVNTLFGTVSLVSLSVLSYERYCTMMRTTKADVTNYRKAYIGICLSWVYSLLWTLPPLFGWSSYGPEGTGTTCSVNWHSGDINNTSYIICLFLFCLVIPFSVIVYCYGKLLFAIRQVNGISKVANQTREQRVLIMVIVMVICFLICWLPYGIVALMATFGRPGLISPATSIIPSVLAKSSTVYNPMIYIFLNKQETMQCNVFLIFHTFQITWFNADHTKRDQSITEMSQTKFYRCFWALLKCSKTTVTSSNKGSSKCTRVCHVSQKNQRQQPVNHNKISKSQGSHGQKL
uniref:Pinopsin-like n=1 Tax=Geotrypetes seraphini TaxID=260995 RepID=A0A6P8S9Y2_GEOSA|nr:pinopsin-like [Geotrypetes seraphini]